MLRSLAVTSSRALRAAPQLAGRRRASQPPFSAAPALVRLELLSGADAGIGVLTLDAPSSRNVLSEAALVALRAAAAEAAAQPPAALRVLVLRGAGPAFCAGADLRERAALAPADVPAAVARIGAAIDGVRRAARGLLACARLRRPFPRASRARRAPPLWPFRLPPSQAALGGGLELALAADVRVASEGAEMGLPEAALAVIPGAGGCARLPRVVGAARAKELIFSARRLRAREAAEWGLVNEAVPGPAPAAFDAALRLARSWLPQGPLALRAAKAAVDGGAGLPLPAALAAEAAAYATIVHTQDRLEGLAAWRGKRKPAFQGV